ncbi:MAG: hypothetical protein PF450_10515 [Bacteroidales bacterium]|jgi:hypothetical protein|nr:hypothetical protein [Bacteroidales bacterium]
MEAVNPEDNKHVAFVLDKLESVREQKQSAEPELNYNVAYYLGHQWVNYSHSTGLQEALMPNAQRRSKRYVRNVIGPVVNTVTSMMNMANPMIKVKPNTESTRDMIGAEIGTTVLKSEMWEGFDMEVNNTKTMPIKACMGSVVYHPYYDPDLGEVHSADEVNEYAGNIVWTEDRAEGKMECDILTRLELSVDGDAETFNEFKPAGWVTKSKTYTPYYLKKRYNKDVEGVPLNSIRRSDALEQFKRAVGNSDDEIKNSDVVLTHECWVRPKKYKEYPDGAVILISQDGQLIDLKKKLPWGIDFLPFVKDSYQDLLGRFWGIPPVTDSRPLQKEINITVTQKKKYKNNYLFPPTLIPNDSGITENQLTGAPNERVTYTPSMANERGGAPHYMLTPQYSGDFEGDIEADKAAIMEIFGVGGVQTGTLDTSTNGRGIGMLQSGADARLSTLNTNMESAYSKLGEMVLRIIASTYQIPRLVKITGAEKTREIKQFKGDMLNGNTNCEIVLASVLPFNKAQAVDTVNTWMTNGMLDMANEEDKDAARRMVKLDSIFAGSAKAKRTAQANFENDILDQGTLGEEVPVMKPVMGPEFEIDEMTGEEKTDADNGEKIPTGGEVQIGEEPTGEMEPDGMPRHEWDDDFLHLKVHEERQLELNYLELIQENPQVAQAYELHKWKHREAILQKEENMQPPPMMGGPNEQPTNVGGGANAPVQ